MFLDKVICHDCGEGFPPEKPVNDCPRCGSTLSVIYDFEKISESLKKEDLGERGTGLTRYRELLPLEDPVITLGEGGTPIVSSSSIGKNLDGDLFFKLEYGNPTGSFKDRGTVITVNRAIDWELSRLADDSSGNAGSSLAGYSAKAGLDCIIYTPEKASGAKIEQIKSYGAELVTVPGPREKTTERIVQDTADSGIYYASHNLSPYFSEGMKTLAYEISEEFGWEPPEHVLIPVGGGALLVGVYEGFRDLVELGWIDEIPRIYAVQTESCNPVVQAFQDSLDETNPVEVEPTIAEGIHISNPSRGRDILEAVRDSGGRALEVTEEQVERYYRRLPEEEGLFVEPTSAVPVAAVESLMEGVNRGERVLVPLTGTGLKYI